jgi:hypothetical protein
VSKLHLRLSIVLPNSAPQHLRNENHGKSDDKPYNHNNCISNGLREWGTNRYVGVSATQQLGSHVFIRVSHEESRIRCGQVPARKGTARSLKGTLGRAMNIGSEHDICMGDSVYRANPTGTAKSPTVGNVRWRFLVIGNGVICDCCRIVNIHHLEKPVITLALDTCLSMHMLERVDVIVLRLKLLKARNTRKETPHQMASSLVRVGFPE